MTLTLYARIVLILAFLIVISVSRIASKKHPTLFFTHWIKSYLYSLSFVLLHLFPSYGNSAPLTLLAILALLGAGLAAFRGLGAFLQAAGSSRPRADFPLEVQGGCVLLLSLVLLGMGFPHAVAIAPACFLMAIALFHLGYLSIFRFPQRPRPVATLLLGFSLLALGVTLVVYPFYPSKLDWFSCLVGTTFHLLSGIAMTLFILEDHENKLQETNRELRLSQEKYTKAFRSSPDAVTITRLGDGCFVEVNDAFYAMTAHVPGEVVGRSTIEIGLIPEGFRSMMLEIIEREGRIENLEMDFFKKNGERRDGLFSAELISVDGEPCLLILLKDVTQFKQAQQDRIEALQEADRVKDEFLSIISHELRTPLNGIMGFSSLLYDQVPGGLNEQQQDFLRRILASSERMLSLVNDLLDFARMQAGQFGIAPAETEVGTLIEEAVAAFEPQAHTKRIPIQTCVRTPKAYLDRERIFQVLSNLLSNALKFTPEGGTIRVEGRAEGEKLVLEVTDNGIGIAPEDQAKLFHPFRQLDMGLTRAVGGVGLGLSISKNIVAAHGGTLTVKSPGIDQGSTFRIELPLR